MANGDYSIEDIIEGIDTTFRSKGLHQNRRYGKTKVQQTDRSGRPTDMDPTEPGWDTTMGKGAMERGMERWQAGEGQSMDPDVQNQEMGMATMGKVMGEMGGSGVILGGEQAPENADLAGTGVVSSTESAGGAEGLFGGGEGGGGQMNWIGMAAEQLGGQIQGGSDEAHDALLKAPEPTFRPPQGRGGVGQGLIEKYVYKGKKKLP